LRKKAIESLSQDELEALECEWIFKARPSQVPPDGDWTTWLIQTGRGWGKTRTGAEFVIDSVRTGAAKRVHLVARAAADVRDVMVEGESGIIAVSPPTFRPVYEPSKRRLTWPNGAVATTFAAETPDQLRGPQCDLAWCDELASWR
jgi:phage terminase large subunit-like protein